ncbi:hypothetical protein J2X52_001483 [Luteimonas sp. 3794]|nr:hypothetical protein [Luteimonas sp. 3794]
MWLFRECHRAQARSYKGAFHTTKRIRYSAGATPL